MTVSELFRVMARGLATGELQPDYDILVSYPDPVAEYPAKESTDAIDAEAKHQTLIITAH
jgi:hypothetical protein